MWSAHATKRPVPYTGLHLREPHRAVILHTNGGGTDNGSLYDWWCGIARQGQHIGAHLQVMTSGHAEQYVDTSQVIYHAYSASEWAVGIETEDDGHPSTPWSSGQLATIIAICRELHVPPQLLRDGASDGIGWHEQYADWNRDGHDCPGSVREQQIRDVILPALRPAPTPAPVPVIEGEDVKVIRIKGTAPQFVTNGVTRRWIENLAERDELLAAGVIDSAVHDLSAATVNAIPLVGKTPS